MSLPVTTESRDRQRLFQASLILVAFLIPMLVPGFVPGWFGRIDLYGVSFVCAICIAAQVRRLLDRRSVGVILGGGCLLFGLAFFAALRQSQLLDFIPKYWISTSFLTVLASAGFMSRLPRGRDLDYSGLFTLLSIIAITAVPVVYADSVRRSIDETLTEALTSQRYRNSLQQTRRLSVIAPRAEVLEIPVATLNSQLEQQVNRLEVFLQAIIDCNAICFPAGTAGHGAHAAGSQSGSIRTSDENQLTGKSPSSGPGLRRTLLSASLTLGGKPVLVSAITAILDSTAGKPDAAPGSGECLEGNCLCRTADGTSRCSRTGLSGGPETGAERGDPSSPGSIV